MERMKIGIVSTYDTLCGMAFFVRDMIKLLKARNYHVIVFAERDMLNVPRIKTIPDVPYYKCWSRRDSNFNQLRDTILQNNVDLIHIVHEPSLFGVDSRFMELVFSLKSNNIKVSLDIESPLPQFKEYFKKLNADLNVFFTTTEPYDIPNSIVLPFPVREYPEISREEARKKLELEEEKIAIVTGFMRQATGIPYILKAYRDVIKQFPTAKLFFLGGKHPFDSDKWIEEGKILAGKYLNKNIFFSEKPVSEEQLILYGAATNVYLNYRKEYPWKIIGGAALRAVSSKRPLIAYDCYSVRCLKHGVIFIKSPKEMSEAVIRIYSDNELEEKLCQEMEKELQYRKWSKVLDKLEGKWKEIVSS